MEEGPVLEVRHLNSYYSLGRSIFGGKGHRKQVLHDVSFHISQGEILGLVGESGCGKTTLSRTILGMLKDYDGEIVVPFAPESELSGLLTPVVRLVLGVYLGAFGWMEGLMPYAYLPLSLLLPAMIGLGYTYGPVFYEKMMKQIAESKRKRRRRKKKTVPEK